MIIEKYVQILQWAWSKEVQRHYVPDWQSTWKLKKTCVGKLNSLKTKWLAVQLISLEYFQGLVSAGLAAGEAGKGQEGIAAAMKRMM